MYFLPKEVEQGIHTGRSQPLTLGYYLVYDTRLDSEHAGNSNDGRDECCSKVIDECTGSNSPTFMRPQLR